MSLIAINGFYHVQYAWYEQIMIQDDCLEHAVCKIHINAIKQLFF